MVTLRCDLCHSSEEAKSQAHATRLSKWRSGNYMRSLSLIAVAFLSVLASLAVAASPELTCGPLPTAGQCPRLDASIVELAQRA